MYQKFIIVGRLTRDGDSKFVPSGMEIYKNCVVTSKKFKKKDGTQSEKVFFCDFSLFNKSANIFAQYTRKGSMVLLEGELQEEKWVNQAGENRSKTTMTVDNFKFLDSKADSQQQPQGQYNQPAPQQQYSQPPAQQQQNQPQGGQQDTPQQEHKIPEIDLDTEIIPF